MKYIIAGVIVLVFAFIVKTGIFFGTVLFSNENSNSETVDQEASYKEMERIIREDSGIEFPSDMVLVLPDARGGNCWFFSSPSEIKLPLWSNGELDVYQRDDPPAIGGGDTMLELSLTTFEKIFKTNIIDAEIGYCYIWELNGYRFYATLIHSKSRDYLSVIVKPIKAK